MLRKFYYAAASWTAIGLLGGLFYREFTRDKALSSGTQLATVHTHALALGMIVSLVALLLVAVFKLPRSRMLNLFFYAWNGGLALTIGAMVVKGVLQVDESVHASSKALAGVSGLGHMTLTVALIGLFLALAPAVRARAAELDAERDPELDAERRA